MRSNGEKALTLARNIVRVGKVSKIHTEIGAVDVFFEDREGIIPRELPLMKGGKVPQIGEQVLCLFLGNGLERGFCLGVFYSEISKPPSGIL